MDHNTTHGILTHAFFYKYFYKFKTSYNIYKIKLNYFYFLIKTDNIPSFLSLPPLPPLHMFFFIIIIWSPQAKTWIDTDFYYFLTFYQNIFLTYADSDGVTILDNATQKKHNHEQ